MPHTVYDNFVLQNRIESTLTTRLDVNSLMTTNASLTAQPGMKIKIAKKTISGNVEELAMGAGNTGEITVSTAESEYEVKTTQGKFVYYDEEEQRDPLIVDAGTQGLVEAMVNDMAAKAVAEFEKATLKHEYTESAGIKYDDVVDAVAKLNLEDESQLFMLINPGVQAKLRKNLRDDLKYVESFVRTGYIGTVNGIPVYISKAMSDGKAVIATREAVTNFVKKGTEVEQQRDGDTRKNTIYSRKVAVVALTDATKVVLITPGE